jgi:hypothetical protein
LKELNLPQYSFRITGNEGSQMILDPIRRKYVKLTPEEWVRQNFVQYLIDKGKYPPGLMGIETNFRLFKVKRRIDILVHNRSGKPVMIVECKAPDIDLNEPVFNQIVTYNMELKVPYIIVTNGITHLAGKLKPDYSGYENLNYIPLYEDLLS